MGLTAVLSSGHSIGAGSVKFNTSTQRVVWGSIANWTHNFGWPEDVLLVNDQVVTNDKVKWNHSILWILLVVRLRIRLLVSLWYKRHITRIRSRVITVIFLPAHVLLTKHLLRRWWWMHWFRPYQQSSMSSWYALSSGSYSASWLLICLVGGSLAA